MPEGDALRRAAARLQPLVGERLEVETPNPRAAAKRIAERIDGKTLLAVEAVGKNLFLRFEDDVVLRSHLRMTGRWRLEPRGKTYVGKPWLILRGERYEGVLWNGPVLEFVLQQHKLRLGPDILDTPLDVDAILANFRVADQSRELGDALLDQRLVAGIGNMWKAEALWTARVSPWSRLRDVTDDELRAVLEHAARLMHARLEGVPPSHRVYRRRVCSRCGGRIATRGQGDDNRTTWWCRACQEGKRRAEA